MVGERANHMPKVGGGVQYVAQHYPTLEPRTQEAHVPGLQNVITKASVGLR